MALSQLSIVQGLPSSQSSGVPPPHTPLVHFCVCGCKHLFPESQTLLSGSLAFAHRPVLVSQPSDVHGLVSAQFGPDVATQVPAAQWSPIEQSLPSEQALASALVLTQPLAALHVSLVHCLLSLQFRAAPGTQAPFTQASLTVHAEPSLHGNVLSFTA